MCKDVEAGVPKLIYEQVTLPDIYFRNPTFVEDMQLLQRRLETLERISSPRMCQYMNYNMNTEELH